MKHMTGLLVTFLLSVGLSLNTVEAVPRQSDVSALDGVVITLKTQGGPCGCVPVNENDLGCCPAYSVSIDGEGKVTYEGISSVKVRGKRTYSIPADEVRELVNEFDKVDFFSLQDSYDDHGIDHANATTISISIGGRTKSIYVFHGEPEKLDRLMSKVFAVSRAAKYVGRG